MQPYSSKYANTHRVMLESLPTKALQRLYRMLDAKSAAHSLQVSYLKSFDNLQAIDHKVINRHSRQRATCDSQRWGVEAVLQRRAKLEWEALNPRLDPQLAYIEKYMRYAKALGVSFDNSDQLQNVVEALLRGDRYLNSIPLWKWDQYHAFYLPKSRGLESGGWSLANSVSTAKTAATISALKRLNFPVNTAQQVKTALDTLEQRPITPEILNGVERSLLGALRIIHTTRLDHPDTDNMVSDIKGALETVQIAIRKTEVESEE